MEHQGSSQQRPSLHGDDRPSELGNQVVCQVEHGRRSSTWNPFRDHQHRHKASKITFSAWSTTVPGSTMGDHRSSSSSSSSSTSTTAASTSSSLSADGLRGSCSCSWRGGEFSAGTSACYSSVSYRNSCAVATQPDVAARDHEGSCGGASCSALMIASSCPKPPRGLKKFGQKVKLFFSKHRVRDTIYCEDDETELESSRGSSGWSGCNESEMRSTTTWSSSSSSSSSSSTTTTSSTRGSKSPDATPTASGHAYEFYEQLYQAEEKVRRNSKVQAVAPSADQRWCRNCSKGFQRPRSSFDQFCGLDCKTAFRFRRW